MRDRIVSGETASKLSELLLKALDDADTNMLGEGSVRGKVPLNGTSVEVTLSAACPGRLPG